MSNVSWINSGKRFTRFEGDTKIVPVVPKGIYEIDFNPMQGWSLERVQDEFTFNFKLYDISNELVDYFLDTYRVTNGNIGFLLNGYRGTGKSVMAKVICNKLDLPVVLVKSFGDNNMDLISYLSSFNFDCVFFFDEFEKQFSEKDHSILQIMDGVFNSEFRRIFLLTTNTTTINENLLSRPSRIRYVKDFTNLDHNVIKSYIKDNLDEQSKAEELFNYIDSLTIATIDIVKSIVEECNIHGVTKFLKFKNIFNVKTQNYMYSATSAEYVQHRFPQGVTVDKILDEIKRYNDLDGQRSIQDKIQAAELAGNDDLVDKLEEEYNKKYNYDAYLNSCYSLYTPVKWDKLQPGDCIALQERHMNSDYGNTVIRVDIEHKLILTKDYEGDLVAFLIKNPNASPSLFTQSSTSLLL